MPIYQVKGGWVSGRSRIVHADVDAAAKFALRRRARITARDRRMLLGRTDAKRAGGPFSGRVPRFSDRLETMQRELLQSRWQFVFDLVMRVARASIREQSKQVEELKGDLSKRVDGVILPRRMDAGPSVPAVIQAVRGMLDDIVEADVPGLELIGREIDEDTTDATDRELSRLFTIPIATHVPSQDVRAWVLANVDFSRSMLDKGLDALERTADEVMRAVAAGKPTLDLAKEYQKRFDLTWNKASFLARDQTANLSAAIAQQRMESLGVEEYQWSTVGDSRVRQEHADLDGNIYKWSQPPVASDAGDRGHPGELWQCLPGDTDVSLCHLARVAYRRWFSGDLAEIVTATGETLRATPNHPVLTRRGWIPAHLVEVGDEVFRVRHDLSDRAEADVEHGVACIQQVFDALSSVCACERSGSVPVDFHGDGADGDVDLVRVDWDLPGVLDSMSREESRELLLAFADAPTPALGDVAEPLRALLVAPDSLVRGAGKALAFFLGSTGHADEHGLATPAKFDAATLEFVRDRLSLHSVELRQSFDALASLVSNGHLGPVVVLGVWRRTLGADVLEPMGAEALADVVSAAPQGLGDLSQVAPIQVEAVRVLRVGSCVFAGHVYNLETATGWYAANGIITHNCRCVALPVLKKGAEERARLIAEADARKESELAWMQASPTVRGEIPNQSKFSDWNRVRLNEIRKGSRASVGL